MKTKKTGINVRVGKVPDFISKYDLDLVTFPRGEGAIAAFDRDLDSHFDDDDDSNDIFDPDCE